MRRKLTITLLTTLMLLGLWQLPTSVSAQQPLTLAMILTGLQTQGRTAETNTLAKRNVYIQRRVTTYGVTFNVSPEIERELRNAGATPALITAIRANGPVQQTNNNTKPSAAFKQVWIDHNITESGQRGMRIHVKFTAYGMRNLNSYLAIYFMDSDGEYLRDKNGKFASAADDVAVYHEITPLYDPAEYNDLTVFMPYAELELPSGSYNLTMDIKLIYKQGGLIQELTKEDFRYNSAGTTQTQVRPTTTVSATLTRIWVDYNVTEGGKRGMRIHVNFEVTGLKGVESKLVARVQRANGTYLTNSNSAYSNEDGQLEVFFEMNPGYPTTVYKDADIFLPYSEIILNSGKYDLKLDVDINYADGELIQHLGFHEFEFDRP